MKILIIDGNGKEIFNRTLLGEYLYDKTGDALHAAILLEAAWKLQRPGSPPRINNSDVFKPMYHPYDYEQPQPPSQSEQGEGEALQDVASSSVDLISGRSCTHKWGFESEFLDRLL